MEFTAYGQKFRVAFGNRVRNVLDTVYDSAGRRGRFRRCRDEIDLIDEDVFEENETYKFIEITEKICIIFPLRIPPERLLAFCSYPFGPDVYYDHPNLPKFYALFHRIEEKELHRNELQRISVENISFDRASTSTDSEVGSEALNLKNVLFKALVDVCLTMGLPGTFQSINQERISDLFEYLIMENTNSLPEPVLVYQRGKTTLPLIASEAKGLRPSFEMSIPEVTMIANECCFVLNRATTCSIDQIIVPFIVTSGLEVQFGCSYLIEPLFPCSMMLTRPFYLFSMSDLMLIRKWILVLAKHCAEFLSTLKRNVTSKKKDEVVGINGKAYFFKSIYVMPPEDPAGKAYSATVRLLWMFHLLSKKEEVRKYIHFPVGNLGYPATCGQDGLMELLTIKLDHLNSMTAGRYRYKAYKPGHPILIYKDLNQSGWYEVTKLISSESIADGIKELFLQELKVAIDLLKDSGVVLTDMRAQNMLYRVSGFVDSKGCASSASSARVEIKLIDLDDAYPLNDPIPAEYFEAMQSDMRYPHGLVNATNEYYDFFLDQISKELDAELKVENPQPLKAPKATKRPGPPLTRSRTKHSGDKLVMDNDVEAEES